MTARRLPAIALGLALPALVGAAPPRLLAQDLGFHEVGARAAALGGAFTAKADDLAAVFYNPAGLASLGGLRIKTNLLSANRTLEASWPEYDIAFSSNPREYLQNLFLSWRPAKRIGLGLGFFSPYNFRVQWLDPLWPGNRVSLSSRIKVHFLSSAVAAEPVKGLSLGAALNYVIVNADWLHELPFEPAGQELPQETEVRSRHELSGRGFCVTAGALWRPARALQVGVTYRNEAAVDLRGSNAFSSPGFTYFTMVPDPYAGQQQLAWLLDLFYVSQFVTGRVNLPREIGCGVALTPFRPLTLYADVLWEAWSRFGAWEFTSENAGGDINPGFTSVYREFWGIVPDYGIQGTPLPLRDTTKIKVGAEWRIGRWFAVRAGYARHQSSVEADGLGPVYPDLARTVYSVGGGYEGPLFSIYDEDEMVGQLSLDVALRFSPVASASSGWPGLEMDYSARRWSVNIGVGFIF